MMEKLNKQGKPQLSVLRTVMFGFLMSVSALQAQTNQSIDILKKHGVAEAVAHLKAQSSETAYDYGLSLLVANRNDDALLWFSELTKRFNDPLYFYGKAFTHWQSGELAEAKRDLEILLERDVPDLVKARSHYVYAFVILDDVHPQVAKDHAHESRRIYQSLGKNGGFFLASMQLAEFEILTKNFREADRYIFEGLEANGRLAKPHCPGKAFELRSDIAWRKQDYRTSLEYAKRAHQAYLDFGNLAYAILIETRVALLNALLGNFQEAYIHASKVDQMALGEYPVAAKIYNHLTFILMDRCQGYDYQIRKREVMEWIESHGKDGELQALLNFLESLSC